MEDKTNRESKRECSAMDGQKLALSVGLIVLAVACFVLGTVAVAIPYWGTYRSRVHEDKGNFGPWRLCKDLRFGSNVCGPWGRSNFKPSFTVFAAGICCAVGVAALGLYCLCCVLHVVMQMGRAGSRYILTRRQVLISKLLFVTMAALLTIAAVALFAFQGNDLERGYIVEVTFCFYMEVVVAIFTTIVMLLTIAEFISWRGEEGETMVFSTISRNGQNHITIGNPAYRDPVNGTTPTVSVTESSRVLYVPSVKSFSNMNGRGSRRPVGVIPPIGGKPSVRRQGSSRRIKRSTSSSSNNKKRHMFSHQDSSSSINTSSNVWNGSVTSMTPSAISESVNGGSSVTDSASTLSTVVSTNPSVRGPLRSSLKKPKTSPPDPYGIQNPGFAGSSPTLSRSSSKKTVRIQTHSTDV